MKNKLVVWFGLVFVLLFLITACSGATPAPQTEEPKSAENVVTEEQTAESVTTGEPTSVEKVNTQMPTASPTETEELTPTEMVATEESITIGPRAGDIAPDFTLPDSEGNMVNLAEELQENQSIVLVFYFEYG